jgi:hypothetical protein
VSANWRSTKKKYRQLEREEINKVWFTGYKLSELFTDDEVADFMAAARRRILGEFHFATEKNPRYKQGSDKRPTQRTDNYIIGVSGRLSDLAKYVHKNMHHPFIKTRDLPAMLSDIHPKLAEQVAQRAQQDILLLVLQVMRHREIWYDEGVGIWQACQSSMDDYHAYRRASRLVKVDDRSYHGRVRSHSKARGIPEGVSVSFAN